MTMTYDLVISLFNNLNFSRIKDGNIAVAYTVWSLKKGLGRKIILDGVKTIQDSYRFSRFVTLSPKTEMATKFHLSNGATQVGESEWANNFEYLLEKT